MNFLRKPFRYTYTNACTVLIAINFCVFALFTFLKIIGLGWMQQYFALVPPNTIHYHRFWQVFTYQFLHVDIWHIAFNMLALYFFGIPLEQKIGTKEFVLFYLLCGTLCGIAGLFIYYGVFLETHVIISTVGASGTVFSIMLAFATLYPSSVIYIWGIIPVPAPLLIVIYAVMELYGAFIANDNVAHAIHLLGLLWAFLYIVIRFGINPIKIWKNLFR
jgi:rhomboid family protein